MIERLHKTACCICIFELYLEFKFRTPGKKTHFEVALLKMTLQLDANKIQARQFTYNVTVRHVRVATVGVEKHYVLHNLSACL